MKNSGLSESDIVKYAIIRVGKKFKSLKEIKYFQKHMDRDQETPNANPLLSYENKVLVGKNDVVQLVWEYTQDVTNKRKNSIIAFELLMTTSPEFFLKLTNEEKEDWIDENIKFLWDEFGADNVVYSVLHEDESTPHIHACIVPKRYSDKTHSYHLSYRDYLGGSKNDLVRLQDKYANKMKKFGLSRGVRGSKAQHVDIKQYYTLINQTFNTRILNDVVISLIEYEAIEPYFKRSLELIRKNGYSEAVRNSIYDFNYSLSARGQYRDSRIIYKKYNTVKMILGEFNIKDEELHSCLDTMYHMGVDKKQDNIHSMLGKAREYQLIKKRVNELQKVMQLYDKRMDLNKEDIEDLRCKIDELIDDKRILSQTIKALSQMTKVSQQAIGQIMEQVKNRVCEQKTPKQKVNELELELNDMKNKNSKE